MLYARDGLRREMAHGCGVEHPQLAALSPHRQEDSSSLPHSSFGPGHLLGADVDPPTVGLLALDPPLGALAAEVAVGYAATRGVSLYREPVEILEMFPKESSEVAV